MNFTLIQVTSRQGSKVKGVWVQHHVGKTLQTATEAAIRTEAANGNKLDIAVIPHESTMSLNGAIRCTGAERLDQQRVIPDNPLGYGRWPDDWPSH